MNGEHARQGAAPAGTLPAEGAGPAPAGARAGRWVGDGLRFAFGTLTVLRVRVHRWDRAAGGAAMVLAPLVGLVVGALAGAAGALVAWRGGGLLGGVAAVAVGALLTRGLHLDGVADVADGLGSGKPAEDALRIMKQSDIGPFGVLTLVLLVLAQTAALAGQFTVSPERGVLAAVVAATAGRAALAWGCLRPVPAARPGGLGAVVAATVRPGAAVAGTLLVAGAAAAVRWRSGVAVLLGVLAAGVLLRRCVRRFGGVTGDVLGALVETAATSALVALALL
ncbi:adenosylcobinamide-GDP ribazoletransferase [Kitasatospora phosalacinea]|uniref:Adenosylcobinamide-GDP ribazoletransferase n=1 Tax=Kitasatospora phosalacinea TaxID=2065 RepID=A0A9W6QEF2_9ACTN|nr:adenosylcobinamide-GDP ribazoletransferase [Kitasatospora phosalacinea]GLW73002.1 adenosylcobinamide-GDP ribazoletransferase [Kitasatospora phosalacinea]